MSYTWIHPPVNRWPSPEAIQKWLDTLTGRPKDRQRDDAIADAQKWLAFAIAREQDLNR